jgi:hypothetical protein
MSREIFFDAPGAGEWVMSRVQGYFTPGHDHSFTTHRDGEILGGFVLCDYFGNSITVHMAGEDKFWCSRDLLWFVFDYGFNHCKCNKMLAPVRSDNTVALALDTRAGWQVEAVLKDIYAPGTHMVVLAMTKDACPWLNHQPRVLVRKAA